jgi:hypothetical protein
VNITQLSLLSKLIGSNPNAIKSAIKLGTVDVLKSLGESKYSVSLESKTLTAQSQKPLSEGSKYWALMTQEKNQPLKLSNLLEKPAMLKTFKHPSITYSLDELTTLLKSKKPEVELQKALLEKLPNATTKDEFSALSTLLLSLQNGTFTIPLYFHNYFSLLQFKKRYNKRDKSTFIDFYATFEELGPISGIISLDGANVEITLNVAFSKTEEFLLQNAQDISYPISIKVVESIEPLYSADINSLLDISI